MKLNKIYKPIRAPIQTKRKKLPHATWEEDAKVTCIAMMDAVEEKLLLPSSIGSEKTSGNEKRTGTDRVVRHT